MRSTGNDEANTTYSPLAQKDAILRRFALKPSSPLMSRYEPKTFDWQSKEKATTVIEATPAESNLKVLSSAMVCGSGVGYDIDARRALLQESKVVHTCSFWNATMTTTTTNTNIASTDSTLIHPSSVTRLNSIAG